MAVIARHIPIPELLSRLQTTLHMTQKELGALVGLSSRTIIRYYKGGGVFLPSQWATLAKALQLRDAALAAYCARMATGSIEELAAGRLPPLPPPGQSALTSPSAAPAAAPPPRPTPSAAHMADSVVCAGAEAMQCTPTQMRPGLVACLQRMVALGMSVEETLGAVRPPDTGSAGAKPGKK
jgi:DNA-binding XRE family transcriptional regulator